MPRKRNPRSVLQPPSFALPGPFIKHIFKNVRTTQTQKLNQSCKYFFLRYNIFVAETLFLTPKGPKLSNIQTEPRRKLSKNIQKFMISKSVEVQDKAEIDMDQLEKMLLHCSAEVITIYPDIPLKVLKLLLTNNKKVESLRVKAVIDENGSKMAVEDIIALVPTVTKIFIHDAQITPKTFDKLVAFNRPKKFSEFELYECKSLIDATKCAEFLEKHFDIYGKPFGPICAIEFETGFETTNWDQIRAFYNSLFNKVALWHVKKAVINPLAFTAKLCKDLYAGDFKLTSLWF